VTDMIEPPRTQVRYSQPLPGIGCPGRWHRTASAARRHDCICPPAVAAYRAERVRIQARRQAGHGASAERLAEMHRIVELRRQGGLREQMAAGIDPRERWRGRDCWVDELTVTLLAAGYRFAGRPPTTREFQLATWRLSAAGMNATDVAAALGVVEHTVGRYREARYKLRAERTRRRHADALWRAWHKHGQRW
jgi:hypothetical protein